MATPTVAWSETTPADNSAFSLGDDRIREAKLQLREIIGINHYMPASTGQSSDWGRHTTITFIEQAGAPTTVATAYIFYTIETDGKCELFVKTPAGTEIQLTSKGDWIAGMSKEVRMWAGTLANIPATWHLCDGTATYPNLIAQFVMGISTSVTEPGTTGGADALSLTTANVANHSHTGTTSSDGAHTHTIPQAAKLSSAIIFDYDAISDPAIEYMDPGVATDGAHVHVDSTSNSTGAADTINNRPAYMELAFICKA